MTITAPGLYEMPESEYHADPCPEASLSRSIAMKLIRESPLHAHYAHPRLGGGDAMDASDAMDMGTVVHGLVLGTGRRVVPITAVYGDKHELAGQPVRDLRTKAAQEQADAIRRAGGVPILPSALQTCRDAADSLLLRMRENPDCAPFFGPARSEIVVIGEEGGFWFRCMIDRLPDDPAAPPYDLKLTEMSARPQAWERRIQLEYAAQCAFYRRVLKMAGQSRPPLLFCVGELKPPHGVAVMAADAALRVLAEAEVERAIETWKVCLSAGQWPGYPPYTHHVGPTTWQMMQHEQAMAEGM